MDELEGIVKRIMIETLQDVIKSLKAHEVDKVLTDRAPEKKKKVFTSPTLEEVKTYVVEKNLPVSAKEFWEYFEAGNWKDAKGNQVKNWKQKILTWSHYRKDNQETKDEEFFKVEW